MASRLRKPPETSSLRVSLICRPFMIERLLVEARMTARAPCCIWVLFCGFDPGRGDDRPWRLPVAVRTRCRRARFSTSQLLAPASSRTAGESAGCAKDDEGGNVHGLAPQISNLVMRHMTNAPRLMLVNPAPSIICPRGSVKSGMT